VTIRTESRSPRLAASIRGIGFWASHLPGWTIARAVMRGEGDAASTPAPRPQPSLLPAAERRRAPDTLAVALEVALQACQAARVPPDQPLCVFASTHGDLAISDYMCETLAATPNLISPIRFHNSVHNAAAGYWSIATASMATYTSLTANEHTFGVGLLEALTQVHTERSSVLFVAYDIAARGPMASMSPSTGLLGVALLLAPDDGSTDAPQLHGEVITGVAPIATVAHSPAAAVTVQNAMGTSVPLFEALAREHSAQVVVTLSPHAALRLAVSPAST
jgi:hypothetical protein